MYSADTATAGVPNSNANEDAKTAVDYSRALRAIGQDLTELFPKVLEIDTDGANFQARGESHPNPFNQVREHAFKRAWKRIFGKNLKVDPTAPQPTAASFTRSYSPEDIVRLDAHYAANRAGQPRRPDNYSLPERLRTMGGIVNSRQGRLKQLRKIADQLAVDYWDRDGKLQTAKLSTVILYRNEQGHDSQSNSTKPKELWEGYDF
ncbi:MAG: hypothetical protein OEN50_07865 [Deltaproteobacteria bacterium]|nr:hypothetical protein [Deltaproteobacteria bacterium]